MLAVTPGSIYNSLQASRTAFEGSSMSFLNDLTQNITRRHFFAQGSHFLGGAALASLLSGQGLGAESAKNGTVGLSHFAPKAKHVI